MKIALTTLIATFVVLAIMAPKFAEATNAGDFSGGVAIGSSYAGTNAAPTNGAIIQGNVGIGTTSPAAVLDVEYPTGVVSGQGIRVAKSAGFFLLGNGTGSASNFYPYFEGKPNYDGPGLQFQGDQYTSPASYAAVLFQAADSTRLAAIAGTDTAIQFANYSTPLMTMLGNGRVGIGTTSPGYTLHVGGSVAGVGAYVNLSDGRYKKNIKPLNMGLEEIEQLKPVTFEWKDPKDDGMQDQQIGFIAQDVEKVLPSIVLTEDNAENTKGIKYNEITPILVKAIQEQQAEIDQLQQTVKELAWKKQITPDN